MSTTRTLIGNSTVLKEVNRIRLLNKLRLQGPASRANLSKSTGLDAKTITNICNELLTEKLITSDKIVISGRGRPAEMLKLNPAAAYSIGVDIGATQITAAIIDFQGNIVDKHHTTFEPVKSRDFIEKKLTSVIAKLLNGFKAQKKIRGIGLAFPGFIDRQKGAVVNSVNFDNLKDFNIASHIQKKFNLPTMIDESSRLMAVGELWFAGHSNTENFICIDAGFGIGMGIVHNGRIFRGANELSGEIGHTVVTTNGSKCKCGKKGCLETVASGRALGKLAESLDMKKYKIKSKDAKALHSAAIAGNTKAKNAIAKAGESIGIAIANVINLFDPGFIVLNGGLVNAGDILIEPLKKSVRTHCLGQFQDNCSINVSKLGNLASALGAAMLPMKEFFELENIKF